VLRELEALSVDHIITDPPYSPRVHEGQRRQTRSQRRRGQKVVPLKLGFGHLSATVLRQTARELGRVARRWVLAFSDVERVTDWNAALQEGGLEPIRVGAWVKEDPMPQFSGDRPAVGFEAIVIAHRPGKKRWNGGGKPARWIHSQGREASAEERLHPTQKPLSLMLELLELFTDEDELVCDPFCGSGTTGVACLRLGRRFLGIERDGRMAAVAADRLNAEASHLTLSDRRRGQMGLFEHGSETHS
jgi:site-specific DNA-methyltransferase (adenine-specific)